MQIGTEVGYFARWGLVSSLSRLFAGGLAEECLGLEEAHFLFPSLLNRKYFILLWLLSRVAPNL